MSTKGLIADKRVKEVTLNSAGKADTLTLADGWTFDGSAGPFKLDNVDHGHRIVKGASNPNAPGRAVRAPKEPRQPSDPSQPYSGPPAPSPKELKAIAPRRDLSDVVYRVVATVANREFAGWMRFTQKPKPSTLPARARDLLFSAIANAKLKPDEAEYTVTPWTVELEREARKENDSGCPWPSLFRPHQTRAHDAPFNSETGQ